MKVDFFTMPTQIVRRNRLIRGDPREAASALGPVGRLMIVLHLLVGISAVAAGTVLSSDPSGRALSFETQWLDHSPFDDYLIPGLFLGIVNGGLNLAAAYALVGKKWWAPLLSLAASAVLVTWIVIQWLIIGYQHWSQLVWAVVFSGMLLLCLPRALRVSSTFVRLDRD
jgi:hypothetical protein